MKVILLLILICMAFCPATAFADSQSDLTDKVTEGIGSIDFSAVQEICGDYIGNIVAKIQQIVEGQYDTAQSFFQMLWLLMGDATRVVLPQLISIFVILVLIGLARKTSGGFISQSTDDTVSFVGIAVILITVATIVLPVYSQVEQIIEKISALSTASLPIILTLVIANGATNLSSVCQPSMVIFSSLVTNLVESIILPISLTGMAFAFVGNLTANVKIDKMTTFLNNLASWLLGIIFTVFSAVTSVQGISASVVDGVSYRMAKFSAKNYIPILGGYVSDGFDMVVASTSLIKNSFGLVLLLTLFAIIIRPIITICCINFGLQAVSALSQPIVDDKCSKIFSGICKSLTFLCALIFAVAFMLAILILIAICCANGV